jgi:hypothetical protein
LHREVISECRHGANSGAGRAAPVGRGRRPAPQAIAWTLPGFGETARVTTSFGELPLQALRKRDPLRTAEGTNRLVHWCDRLRLDNGFLTANPDAQPILITANALGNGLPRADILVSPHQRIGLLPPGYQQEYRLARDLTGRPGILRRPQETMTYCLFHCEQPAVVIVEGVAVAVAP